MQRIFTWIFAAALLFAGGSWIYAQTIPTGTNTTQGSGGGGGGGFSGCTTGAPCYFDTNASGNLYTAVTSAPLASVPTTSGGLTTYFLQPTASTNSNSVKGTPGQVYYVLAMNNSATVNYLRFYNTASGPTCSSATNLVFQVQIPASTSVGGVSIPLPFGIAFATGIGICVTSGYATTDATNATASAISLTIGYN